MIEATHFHDAEPSRTGGRSRHAVTPVLASATIPRAPWPVVVGIAAVALAVQAFFVSATPLWVATDSGGYIKLAAALTEHLDLGHAYFQFRPPGYPIFLATVFHVFGAQSPPAIQALQHAMVAGVAVLTALTAWTLLPRRDFALLAGLLSAVSLHLSGYADTVLTEVPYALLLTAAVFALVRFHTAGHLAWLALASALAGLCAITKGIGQLMPFVCIMVAVHHAWAMRRRSARPPARAVASAPRGGRPWRSGAVRSAAVMALTAIAPAAAFILPVMLSSYVHHGHFQITCQGGNILYHRMVCVDGMDSRRSEALNRIRSALRKAKRDGLVSPAAEMGSHFLVNEAYRKVHGVSMADAAAVMGRAGRDLVLELPGRFLLGGLKHAYRTLMMPDQYYRVRPGDMPEDMFDLHEAQAGISRVVGVEAMEKFLPLGIGAPSSSASEPRASARADDRPGTRRIAREEAPASSTTPRAETMARPGERGLYAARSGRPLWRPGNAARPQVPTSATGGGRYMESRHQTEGERLATGRVTWPSRTLGKITDWYHDRIAKGVPITGLLDTPYEEFVLICVIGGLLSLMRRNRTTWMIPGIVVVLHVTVSAYLGGTHPRYAVPVHPLLHMFGALSVVTLLQAAVAGTRRLKPQWAQGQSSAI